MHYQEGLPRQIRLQKNILILFLMPLIIKVTTISSHCIIRKVGRISCLKIVINHGRNK